MRCVVAANVEDQRQEDREDDPLLDADHDDDDRGQQRDHELVLAQAADLAHARDVDQLEADQEDDRREHRVRAGTAAAS